MRINYENAKSEIISTLEKIEIGYYLLPISIKYHLEL